MTVAPEDAAFVSLAVVVGVSGAGAFSAALSDGAGADAGVSAGTAADTAAGASDAASMNGGADAASGGLAAVSPDAVGA